MEDANLPDELENPSLQEERENPQLPDEIIQEILTKLPPKKIARTLLFNHTWNTIFSSPEFIKANMASNIQNNRKIFLFDCQIFFSPISYELTDATLLSFTRNIIEDDPPKEVVAHCRGLVCEATQDDRYYIYNPLTRKGMLLPTSQIVWEPQADWCTAFFGMGYKESTSCYHLVRVLFFQCPELKTNVDVYCSRTNAWTRLSPFPYPIPSGKFAVWVRGLIHFQVYRSGSSSTQVVTFNLQNYSWGTIDFPPPVGNSGYSWEIGDLDEDTLVVYPLSPINNRFGVFDIWLLQGYGEEQRWRRVHIELNPIQHRPHRFTIQPVHFLKPTNTEILFRKDPCGTFSVYNLIEERFYNVDCSENIRYNGYCKIHNIVQSFASPIP